MSLPTQVSPQGVADIVIHEGFVSKAYRDPVGIWTIGTGFTSRSRVAKRELGTIKAGMRITRERNDKLLAMALNEEYVPPVLSNIGPRKQNQLDACASVSFNCGPGSTKWKWAKALAAGKVSTSAALLRKTAVTARGRKLRGLVNRRAAEADMLEHGKYKTSKGYPTYPPTEVIAPAPDKLLKEYQAKLAKLGFNPGPVDGYHGPRTTAAVKAFQKAHPQLILDGILGRATMAQIDRSIDLLAKGKGTAVKGSGGTAAGGAASEGAKGVSDVPFEIFGMDPTGFAIVAGLVLTVAALAWVAWKYRDEIQTLLDEKEMS